MSVATPSPRVPGSDTEPVLSIGLEVKQVKYNGAVSREGLTSQIVSDGLKVKQKCMLSILSVYVYWHFKSSEII